MGAKTLLSFDEFMALPDDGNRHELNQGELVVMPPPSTLHDLCAAKIMLPLSVWVAERKLGMVLANAGYVLFRQPERTVRQPDVSFVSRERLAASREAVLIEGAPELAIEVVSPSDSAEDLNVKVRQYLEAGGKEVWVFYPKTRSVQVSKADGRTVTLSESDTLTTDLFPGWSARVAGFFQLDY